MPRIADDSNATNMVGNTNPAIMSTVEPQTQDIAEKGPRLKELLAVLNREKDSDAIVIRSTPKVNWQGNERFPRSSQYRGVSKNGNFWQVSNLSNTGTRLIPATFCLTSRFKAL